MISAAADIRAEPAPPLLEAGRLNLAEAARYLWLYAFLVIFSFGLKYALAVYLSDWYRYFHMEYDTLREHVYVWLCFLTPLALLPAGTRLETGSQIIFTMFNTFVAIGSPFFLVGYTSPDVFWNFYAYLFVCYLLLAVATRIRFRPIPSPLTNRGYKILLGVTLLAFVAVLGIGVTQNFHIVSFSDLYNVRYSEEMQSAAYVQRFANMFMFGFGGLAVGLCVAFRRYWLALLFLSGYIICYGLVQYKAAALSPMWFIYLFLAFRYFVGNSTLRFYMVLTLPFWVALAIYWFSPVNTGLKFNLVVFGILNLMLFRQYGVTPNALGLYYNFFQSHPVTYWSHITGLNAFLHYPYGDHTIAIEMDRAYALGNYNSSFLATEAIGSYGYQALPAVGIVVATFFILLNTSTRDIPVRILILMMIMPALMLDERPLGTSLLTGGIIFLVFYLAWLPRSWLKNG
ncbi:MAG: hypothetical protein BGN85_06770 [Alphaproteobacteria bacterium 64-11]|nr:hypothetical protein [Alphaproteobacteria bacterium]OJU13046.1 MAG: hypothetical protein BGN85_06770 [Alphaproteobacteria bacterium 64-11]